MAERLGTKPPFSETQRIYRTGAETLVGRHLANAGSDLVIKIAGEGSRLEAHLLRLSMSMPTLDTAESAEVIGIQLKGNLVFPVALPVNYRSQILKRSPESTHNNAQMYLFGDQRLEEIGDLYGVKRQAVHVQIRDGVSQMLRAVPQEGVSHENLNFRKPTPFRQKPDRILRDWKADLASLENPGSDRELVKELFFKVADKFLLLHPELFVYLSKIAREVGLYPRYKRGDVGLISDRLDSWGVPVREAVYEIKSGKQKGQMQVYYLTHKMFVEEAKQALIQAEGPEFDLMRKPPFIVLGPKPEKIPNTTDLHGRREKGYSGVFDLLAPFGIASPQQLRNFNITLIDLIGINPPAAVYFIPSSGAFFVANTDREKLGKYLGEQLKNLRQSNQISAAPS